MTKMPDYGPDVSEFELQSCYYVRFRTNILWKDVNFFIPTPNNDLNNITAVLVQGLLWY